MFRGGVCTGGGARSMIQSCSLPLSLCLCLFRPVCQPYYLRGPFVSFTAAQPVELYQSFKIIILYYCEQILKYFNCGPWIQFSHSIHIHHESEMDGDYYTDAQCEVMVMCGNNHWIITPNLTRSIQIDLWPGGPKSYLWQPVIASPVIQQTKMEEPQTAVSEERTVTLTTASLYLLLLKPQVFYLGWIQRQPVIQQLPSVRHTDEAQ